MQFANAPQFLTLVRGSLGLIIRLVHHALACAALSVCRTGPANDPGGGSAPSLFSPILRTYDYCTCSTFECSYQAAAHPLTCQLPLLGQEGSHRSVGPTIPVWAGSWVGLQARVHVWYQFSPSFYYLIELSKFMLLRSPIRHRPFIL